MKNRVDTKWYGNGQKKSEHNYNVGFCISLTSFLKISFNVKENGLETHCYESGQKQEEISYKDGKEDGLNSGWYENGERKKKQPSSVGKRFLKKSGMKMGLLRVETQYL